MGSSGQKGVRERRRTVTDEPFIIADELRGWPLATARRRAAAVAADGLLLAIFGTPLFLLLTWAAVYVQSPGAARVVVAPYAAILSGGAPGESGWSQHDVAELLQVIWRRQPNAVPVTLAPHVARGDLDEVERLLGETPLFVMTALGNNNRTYFEPATNRLYVAEDALLGPLSSLIGLTAIFMVYFTVTTWAGGGCTPGKWLFGLQVRRLDGRALNLWDAFGRAGGYAASASTLGLGFLQAGWDANRQALHDRIAGTVVVRRRRPAGDREEPSGDAHGAS
ncbi:MAG: RDD family protein [Acidobacteriota bacterium]|jgi:uncharacterized RDD family membrane protein YckC